MIEKWYDISCNNCNLSLSSDYETGMDKDKETIIKWAKEKGWLIKSSKNTICPKCKETR